MIESLPNKAPIGNASRRVADLSESVAFSSSFLASIFFCSDKQVPRREHAGQTATREASRSRERVSNILDQGSNDESEFSIP